MCQSVPYFNMNISLYMETLGIATGWTGQVRFPVVQDFSVPHSVQSESGARPVSYPVDTGGKMAGE
jgi:hypothetical protein